MEIKDGAFKDQLIKSIDGNVWNYYSLPSNGRVFKSQPKEMLSPNRLDIVSRYLFVKHSMLGCGVEWSIGLYRDLLFVSNRNFIDGDGRKKSFLDYLSKFLELITSTSKGGLDVDRVVIPFVGDTIVDGAHRFAVALYFGIPIYFVEVCGPVQKMNWYGLTQLGLRKSSVEQLLQEYVRQDENTFCMVFFGQKEKLLNAARYTASQHADILYEKELLLTEQGRLNIMELLYGHEPWWESSKAHDFAHLRLRSTGKVNVIFFSPFEKGNSRALKEKIRQLLPGDFLLHANDTHTETEWISDVVLSPSGVTYLNKASFKKPKRYSMLLNLYRDLLRERPDCDEFAIDSGAVLGAFGVRDCNDLDYISARGQVLACDHLNSEGFIEQHNEEYASNFSYLDKLITNPDFHFKWKGLKFLSLDSVYLLKSLRGSYKDLEDLDLIFNFKAKVGIIDKTKHARDNFINWYIYRFPVIRNQFYYNVLNKLPRPIYVTLRFCWRLIKGSKQ